MRKLFALLLVTLAMSASGQVLARPGWAGSGVTVEPWWRRAVFYRITPSLYQDSDGDGVGDLRGVAQRLDYIQSLGVDAIVLAPPIQPEGFDDLAKAASLHHLRLLVEIPTPDASQARLWLNQGAAGLYVDVDSANSNVEAVLRDLRQLTDSYPGERILLTGPAGNKPTADGAHLTAGVPIGVSALNVTAMRQQLVGQVDGFDTTNPLLQLPGIAVAKGGSSAEGALDRTLATMLLTSRAAVIFDAGRELGLRSYDGKPVAMQWTPSNKTTAPVEASTPIAEAVAKPDPNVYGAFRPYVAPKPVAPKPAVPAVDLNALPGFSSVDPTVDTAANGTAANAAAEDGDEHSLLNLYRRLIALHHGNGTIRNGTQYTLDLDAQHTLLWLRRAPAGARTSASIVVACNLSENPVQISLRGDFERLHLHEGTLRPLLTSTDTALLTSSETTLPLETTDHLILPAFTIFLGELYHEGGETVQATPHRHHRR